MDYDCLVSRCTQHYTHVNRKKETFFMSFVKRLLTFRKKNETATSFAQRIGITPTQLRNWRLGAQGNGEIRVGPRVDTGIRLAALFGVRVGWLLSGEPPKWVCEACRKCERCNGGKAPAEVSAKPKPPEAEEHAAPNTDDFDNWKDDKDELSNSEHGTSDDSRDAAEVRDDA